MDELREMSLKLRSTSVIMDSANMIEDKEIRRIGISLLRLERELKRLYKRNEEEENNE
tara:strand:+ start:2777 stop:2950 length:174 start_codon:yes stop_codon:yes gene_type:complete